jgi:hypothetical protein
MYRTPTKRRSVTRLSPTHVQSNFAEQRLSHHDVDVNAGEVHARRDMLQPAVKIEVWRCSDNRITGHKVRGRGTRRVVNRAATGRLHAD